MLTSVGFTTARQPQTSFKSAFIFNKGAKIENLIAVIPELDKAATPGIRYGYPFFCFFKPISDAQAKAQNIVKTKLKDYGMHYTQVRTHKEKNLTFKVDKIIDKKVKRDAKNQMKKLGAKPVKVDTPDGEYLTFAVEKKIDELVKTVKKIMPTKKTGHNTVNNKRKPHLSPHINKAYERWLLE